MTPDRLRRAIKDAPHRHLGEAEIVLAAAPLLLELWDAANKMRDVEKPIDWQRIDKALTALEEA